MSKRAADNQSEFEDKASVAKTNEGPVPSRDNANSAEEADAEMGEFEDPYGDDFESEDEEIFEAGENGEEDEEGDEAEGADGSAKLQSIAEDSGEVKRSQKETPKIYLPNRSAPLGPDEIMEPDPTTYNMLHNVNVEWPCLSFDILEDNNGNERRGYPQSVYMVSGSQAQRARDNEITVMKLSSLSKTLINDGSDDSDNEDEEDDDKDAVDSDPILESKSLPTLYTTNRIRVNPFAKKTGEYFTASSSESGDVYIWDLSTHFRSFDNPGTNITKQMNKPVYTVNMHGRVEGYALDWSPLNQTGALLSGDVSGKIYLTSRAQSGGWTTEKAPFVGHNGSVEEIQWSRSEKTVFASGGTDGCIKIWDTRTKKHKAALSIKASETDINVMTWNSKVTYLLGSGHDDGQWCVWDLRNFTNPKAQPTAVASFDFHKSPITSMEFNPNDESVLAVASEDNTVTLWDLSVEADDEEIKAQKHDAAGDLDDIPSQLLFVHWQRSVKEVHWHKQIPGALVSTGADGFCIWKTISV